MANYFVHQKMSGMALLTLVASSGYLRPCEAMSLQVQDLLPPASEVCPFWSNIISPHKRERRTKTGESDDIVVMDTK